MSVFYRGTTVILTATFLDKDGNPATVNAAQIAVSYARLADSKRVADEDEMDITGNVGSYEWDSSEAKPGTIKWSAKGFGPGGVNIQTDGDFILSANIANRVIS